MSFSANSFWAAPRPAMAVPLSNSNSPELKIPEMWNLRKQLEPWLQRLDFGRLPANDHELLLGREMAMKLGLFAGDSCLVSPRRRRCRP